MKSMSEFARTLRDQAVKLTALDVDFARATVAELRHNLDAIEALRQKHMQTMSAEMKAKMEAMSAEMKSKMQMMMEKMDKDRAKLKDQVSALETDVQADRPNSEQVTAHTNALLKQLGMMEDGRWKQSRQEENGDEEEAGNEDVSVRFQPTVRELHLEKLWDRNIAIATRLVNTVTTPMLLKVVRSGKLQPSQLGRLSELPREREIVAYCQSGQRSYNAARSLSQSGFRVRNLTGAYRTWKTAQLHGEQADMDQTARIIVTHNEKDLRR